jgi:hypothetical protein
MGRRKYLGTSSALLPITPDTSLSMPVSNQSVSFRSVRLHPQHNSHENTGVKNKTGKLRRRKKARKHGKHVKSRRKHGKQDTKTQIEKIQG